MAQALEKIFLQKVAQMPKKKWLCCPQPLKARPRANCLPPLLQGTAEMQYGPEYRAVERSVNGTQ
ncbi:hypothetical protein F7725_024582 [Dissostichus mawsoni]|uniref:Uncharacterized protein n=1 Tax=Dissostichus mawsoni TaxID=36200 RepID=A0A7J5XAE2_DISMA|nr:hypothetical protein F7725_024582 [Dissostichus mawsoni]